MDAPDNRDPEAVPEEDIARVRAAEDESDADEEAAADGGEAEDAEDGEADETAEDAEADETAEDAEDEEDEEDAEEDEEDMEEAENEDDVHSPVVETATEAEGETAHPDNEAPTGVDEP
ncbi:MAG: hypothetical protein ABEJ28_03020 [Salinigranum sp.]